MKKGLDPNKIFAAVLMAVLVAAFSGFISRELIHVKFPKEKGYAVAVTETSDSGATAEAPKEAEPIDALMASASVEEGQKVSRACTACHTFDKGGPNRVGPNLFGVVGHPIAGHDGFAYSDALKAKKGGAWTVGELNKWLFNPKTYAPGTKMMLQLSKTQDRANLIAYLQSLK
jgi:cytochrome c